MIGAAAAYVSGLFFASFFFDSIGIITALCTAVLIAVYGRLKGFKAADYLILTVFFVGAVTVNRSYTHFVYDKITAYSETEGSFRGEITDYSVYNGEFASYTLKGKINNSQNARISVFTTALDADYGDIVTIEKCTFNEFEKEYLFDSLTRNKSRHIYLEAEKISGISVKKQKTAQIKRSLAYFREEMTARLQIEMHGETGGFLSGMVFGGSQNISNEISSDLYRLGIGHILSVSGLHVSAIGAVIMTILKRLRINRYIRFAAVNIFLILLAGLAEYPVSAVRALFMLDMLYSAELFGEQNDSLNSLCLAALAICICDCYAVYSSSFILSFSGTFGIAIFSPYMTKNIDKSTLWGDIKADIVSAVCVSLAVMPASMYYFDEISLTSPLSNILLLPLCTAALICGFAFVLTGGVFTFLLLPAELFLSAVISISDALSAVPFFTVPRMNEFVPVIFIAGAGITALTYLFSGRKRAVTAVLTAVVLISASMTIIMAETIKNRPVIAVLGDKTSAVVVISYGNERIIADLEGSSNEKYVEKYLANNGRRKNEYLLLTSDISAKTASYSQNLRHISSENVYAITDEINFTNDKCSVCYFNGTLEVTVENRTYAFCTAKTDDYISADLTLIYGNIPKSAEITENNYIISQMGNNIEILPQKGNKYRIRSL